MNDRAILSHVIDTAHLPATGADMTIEASTEQRTALAAAYDLVAVNGLSVTATLTPAADGIVAVAGRVAADIVQSCVVSLEPVAQHIDEAFAARFARAEALPAQPAAGTAREVAIDPHAPDPPEAMDGTAIDLGALAEEIFVLAIDPYPRAPGAELPPAGSDVPDSAEESPFAVLREVMRTRK